VVSTQSTTPPPTQLFFFFFEENALGKFISKDVTQNKRIT
jgi:hypothetical protein